MNMRCFAFVLHLTSKTPENKEDSNQSKSSVNQELITGPCRMHFHVFSLGVIFLNLTSTIFFLSFSHNQNIIEIRLPPTPVPLEFERSHSDRSKA